MRCEVLLDPVGLASRGRKMLEAMIAAAPDAGVEVIVNSEWKRAAPVLMSYGLGHMTRRAWTREHVRTGGRLIGWDLGYWNRDVPVRFNMRLTLDEEHPHRWIGPEAPERFDAAGIVLREDYSAAGPIVLVGLGRKQRRHKGHPGLAWEMAKLQELRKRFKGRRIVYRPKRLEAGLPGVATATGAIEDVLRGASLVVTAHSNVAIDACIAGVPVECDDGAAFALYRGNPNPNREQRRAFLQSLAWWQWSPVEALQAWEFIKSKLGAA